MKGNNITCCFWCNKTQLSYEVKGESVYEAKNKLANMLHVPMKSLSIMW